MLIITERPPEKPGSKLLSRVLSNIRVLFYRCWAIKSKNFHIQYLCTVTMD